MLKTRLLNYFIFKVKFLSNHIVLLQVLLWITMLTIYYQVRNLVIPADQITSIVSNRIKSIKMKSHRSFIHCLILQIGLRGYGTFANSSTYPRIICNGQYEVRIHISPQSRVEISILRSQSSTYYWISAF